MPELVVFAYNFPHKKTQDFLLRLFVDGFRVAHVLAADPVKLDIPPASVRTKIRHRALVHPRTIASRIGAEYSVVDHSGSDALALLDRVEPELGVIAGARILDADVIDRFSAGVLNFHPGLIPEVRGLDAMLWAIRSDVPQGVTAHLIDRRVDAGRIVERRAIGVFADDTALDLQERLYETQLELLEPAIRTALEAAAGKRSLEPVEGGSYNRKMDAELERETLGLLPDYVRRHAKAESAPNRKGKG